MAAETMLKENGKRAPGVFLRWVILICLGLAMFGNYYVYDSVALVGERLETQLGITDTGLGTINSFYNFPNLIMVLIGGIIIDRIGTKRALIWFATLCLIGAFITAMNGSFWGMVAGRLVFGLGAESMIVAASAAIAKWFKGKEISFAFAMKIMLARLGSYAAENSPNWAPSAYGDWQAPLIIAVGVGAFAVAVSIIYGIIERSTEDKLILAESKQDEIKLKEIINFGKSFWFIALLCGTFYSALFPFKTFAVKYFQFGHKVDVQAAGTLTSITTLFTLIFTPLFGAFIDRIGRRSLLMIFGSFLLIPAYILLGIQGIILFIPLAMLGISFSLIPAVMWPSVAYVVKENQIGTAYGLMTMVQNICWFLITIVVGVVNDSFGAGKDNVAGYWPMLGIFAFLGLLGMVWGILLKMAEKGPGGHGLDLPMKKKA